MVDILNGKKGRGAFARALGVPFCRRGPAALLLQCRAIVEYIAAKNSYQKADVNIAAT